MRPFRGIHVVLAGMLAAGCASPLSGHGTSAGTAAPSTALSGRAMSTPVGSSAPIEASLADALRVVRQHHYSPVDNSPPWYPQHTLNGIVGYPTDSVDGHNQFVFFFVGNKYIGTDTDDPSTEIQYGSGADTTVTVKYFLYRSADPLCCPTGGTASVGYHWTGHKLEPLDPIPPLTGSVHR
jgi:LppP/LprE lipoprotein